MTFIPSILASPSAAILFQWGKALSQALAVSSHCIGRKTHSSAVRPLWRTTTAEELEVAEVADFSTILVMGQGKGKTSLYRFSLDFNCRFLWCLQGLRLVFREKSTAW